MVAVFFLRQTDVLVRTVIREPFLFNIVNISESINVGNIDSVIYG